MPLSVVQVANNDPLDAGFKFPAPFTPGNTMVVFVGYYIGVDTTETFTFSNDHLGFPSGTLTPTKTVQSTKLGSPNFGMILAGFSNFTLGGDDNQTVIVSATASFWDAACAIEVSSGGSLGYTSTDGSAFGLAGDVVCVGAAGPQPTVPIGPFVYCASQSNPPWVPMKSPSDLANIRSTFGPASSNFGFYNILPLSGNASVPLFRWYASDQTPTTTPSNFAQACMVVTSGVAPAKQVLFRF